MLPHSFHTKLLFACAVTLVFCGGTYAALTDYNDGFTAGDYDRMYGDPPTNRSSSLYAMWQSNPTLANWDRYWGYVHAWEPNPLQDYSRVPAMPSSSSSSSSAETTLAFQQVNIGSNRIVGSFLSMLRGMRRGATAGDLFQNTTFSVDASRASVDDNILGGSGHDTELGLLLDTHIGDKLNLGFGVAHDWYEIDAADWDESTVSYDLILSYGLADHFSVGAFLNFSQIDIEDQIIGGIKIAGQDRDRWGGGLLANYDVNLSAMLNWGITGAITSMNKTSLGRLFDNEDSAGILLTDLNVKLNDVVSTDFYVSYLGLLDRETGGAIAVSDGSYYTMGVDLGVRTSKKSEFTIGYGTTAADNDHEEDRLNLAFTVEF